MPAVKPTKEEALQRLRLDDGLAGDVEGAIEQAHAQTLKYLDGPLFATQEAADASGNPKAILCTADIVAAQLVLVDVLCGPNSVEDQDRKRTAAYNMLRLHRNHGA
ncbi:hypothetical protein [Comamonas odontotermitis]|uniref:hypothetical protein n=1 Tax=Comamonas odontotermitis TaxID=379895 RepID=UPI003751F2DE